MRLGEYRFLLAPRWIAFHLLVLAGVITMVNLGFWQLRRLDERQAFNALVTTNLALPLVPIETLLTPRADTDAIEWRPVTVTGTFLHDARVVVVNKTQDAQNGANVVDPLVMSDGTMILVNRGFQAQGSSAGPPPTGTVTIEGILRVSEQRGIGQIEDASGVVLTEVRRLDIDKLNPQFDGDLLPMFVEQTVSDDPALRPLPAPTLVEGPHLSYAVQWFIFSIAVIVGWTLAVRRSHATRSGKPRKRRGAPPIADELSRVGT